MDTSERGAPRTGAWETTAEGWRDGELGHDTGAVPEFRQTLVQRVRAYGLLKDLYSYPLSEESLAALANWHWMREGDSTNGGSLAGVPPEGAFHTVMDGLATLGQFLAVGPPWFTVLEECDREYTRLFLGPGPEVVPPYASFYVSHGRLMTGDTLSVQRVYAGWGLKPSAGGNYPPDHIAFELGFLAFLAERILDAYDGGKQAERNGEEALATSRSFLAQHMTVWVPRMVQRLLQITSHPLFRGLGLLTIGYLSVDLETLAADG